ncbi:hypothetical protein [Litchfieldella qijiaojingensis]|uniref:hypothetical protein n=1 Tax=Litchfieldella qijiaojingensis TaxID=980347 RepID=UPI00167C37A6|nr:hypothetical protein [Halomonas qijiaojingensis]
MFDRIADIVRAMLTHYYAGYGNWRFSDTRSAQFATSGRQSIGGTSARCSLPCQGHSQ